MAWKMFFSFIQWVIETLYLVLQSVYNESVWYTLPTCLARGTVSVTTPSICMEQFSVEITWT